MLIGKHIKTLYISALVFIFGGFTNVSHAELEGLNRRSVRQILEIANAISHLRPRLPDTKYIEYAIGIYRACNKYKINPKLMVAITHQETSFRENLPEGKAGEIGLTQIRKKWIQNKKFRREFKNAKVKDLRNPAKSFMFSAWILRDIRNTESSDSVPWWSYYNARRLKNRLRYYMHVSKKLHRIRKYGPFAATPKRFIASTPNRTRRTKAVKVALVKGSSKSKKVRTPRVNRKLRTPARKVKTKRSRRQKPGISNKTIRRLPGKDWVQRQPRAVRVAASKNPQGSYVSSSVLLKTALELNK